jgi:hypothetical protein
LALFFQHSNARAKCPQAVPKVSCNGIFDAFQVRKDLGVVAG